MRKPSNISESGEKNVKKIITGKLTAAGALALSLTSFSLGVQAEPQEVQFKCLDDIPEAKPQAQASMVAGTIVGMVLGGSSGGPEVGVFGAYVGCNAGQLFAKVFEEDPIAATLLLGSNWYMLMANEETAQKVFVYAGKAAEKITGNTTNLAVPKPENNPLKAAEDGVKAMPLAPIVGGVAGALAASGMSQKDIGKTLLLTMPAPTLIASVVNSGEGQRLQDGVTREAERAGKETGRILEDVTSSSVFRPDKWF